MNRSERKIVLITGARSGIGRACADALAAQGHQVFGTSRTPPSETPGFTFLPMDVNVADSVEAGVQSVLEETGRLDVVVNNAGFGYGGSVEDTVGAIFDQQVVIGIGDIIRVGIPSRIEDIFTEGNGERSGACNISGGQTL